MGRVHTSHIIWLRVDVISGKVEQGERDIEGSGRYDKKHGKTLEKRPTIRPGINGILHQYI